MWRDRRWTVWVVALLACNVKPPHVVLTIQDEAGVAAGATQVVITGDKTTLIDLAGVTFPTSVTLVEDAPRVETVWVEAHRDGAAVARARVELTFRRKGGSAVAVLLRACESTAVSGEICGLETLGASGICVAGSCGVSRCGDGYPDGTAAEVCDDGNDIDDDDCFPDGHPFACQPNVCGDGYINTGVEPCDDGNISDEDECRVGCIVNVCGDGFQNRLPTSGSYETCDDGDGNGNPNDGCFDCAEPRWESELLLGFGRGKGDPLLTTFNGPQDISLSEDGVLYITDFAELEPGQLPRIWGTPAVERIRPRLLAWDLNRNHLSWIGGSGHMSFTYGGGLPARETDLLGPECVATAPSGEPVIHDPVGRLILTGDGTFQPWDGAVGDCRDMVFDPTGRLIFANNIVYRISNGGLSENLGLSAVDAVALSPEGLVYATRFNQVYRIDPDEDPPLPIVFAGNATDCGPPPDTCGDEGDRLDARFTRVVGLATDPIGNLYVADSDALRIRKIDVMSGEVSTLAGDGTLCDERGLDAGVACGDGGLGPEARLGHLEAIAVYSDGLYVSDRTLHRIRRVDLSPPHTIDTVAGTGEGTTSALPVLSTPLDAPVAIAAAITGEHFVATRDEAIIYRYEFLRGEMVPYIGGIPCYSGCDTGVLDFETVGFGEPVDLIADGLSLYVVDAKRRQILAADLAAKQIETIAGGTRTCPLAVGVPVDCNPSGTTAADAYLAEPVAAAISPTDGHLYVADHDHHRIYRLTPDPGGGFTPTGSFVETVAGNVEVGLAPDPEGPGTVAVVRPLDAGDTALTEAIPRPTALTVELTGSLLIATDHQIVRVVATGGQINSSSAVEHVAGRAGDPCLDGESCDGPARLARFSDPRDLLAANEGVVVADDTRLRFIRIPLLSGPVSVSTIAGTGARGNGGHEGPAVDAELGEISALAHSPSGDLLVAQTAAQPGVGRTGLIRLVEVEWDEVTITPGNISTEVGYIYPGDGPSEIATLLTPVTFATDTASKDTWVIDDARLRRIDGTTGAVDTITGHPYPVAGTDARLGRYLEDAVGIVFDPAGPHVYVAERGADVIRRIDTTGNPLVIEDYAGDYQNADHIDGAVAGSRFAGPATVALHPVHHALYVADSGNHVVRRINLDTDQVETVVGVIGLWGRRDEDGLDTSDTLLYAPAGLAFTPDGDLYVADTGNHRVLFVAMDAEGRAGTTSVVIGDGVPGEREVGRPASSLRIDSPRAIAADRYGNLFVASGPTIQVVGAGPDGVAMGDDAVTIMFGKPPFDALLEEVARCLSHVELSTTAVEHDTLVLVDACEGLYFTLQRQ